VGGGRNREWVKKALKKKEEGKRGSLKKRKSPPSEVPLELVQKGYAGKRKPQKKTSKQKKKPKRGREKAPEGKGKTWCDTVWKKKSQEGDEKKDLKGETVQKKQIKDRKYKKIQGANVGGASAKNWEKNGGRPAHRRGKTHSGKKMGEREKRGGKTSHHRKKT